MPESPRWHEGRLWLSNWGTRQIVAVDLDGNSDVVGEGPEGPDGLGWATNWLPDGRPVPTDESPRRRQSLNQVWIDVDSGAPPVRHRTERLTHEAAARSEGR
jgi:hypothetical protein